MEAREAFIAGARAWKAEAELSTHRNLCKDCEENQTFSLCNDGKLLLDQAQEAKKEMMEVAKLLDVTELPARQHATRSTLEEKAADARRYLGLAPEPLPRWKVWLLNRLAPRLF